MKKEIIIQHVAIECRDRKSADRFFTAVLGIPKVKSSILSKELSAIIFKMNSRIRFNSYDNGKTRFEVFFTNQSKKSTYNHIGIEVENKTDFIIRCKQHQLEPFFVEKEEKQLLFVRDFSDNLFEIV